MKHSKTGAIKAILLAAFCLWQLPSAVAADTKNHTCGSKPEHTLQRAIDKMNPGDTLFVSGTCNENVLIHDGHHNIAIVGQGTARIDGSGGPTLPVLRIRGRNITVKGFTIIGGRWGVKLERGGTGTVDGNLIKGASVHGVAVNDNSFARIVDNTIEQHGANGICVCEHSSAEIGFRGDFTTTGSANVIRNNATNGIAVGDASYAEIESNSIYGNIDAGILVIDGSSAKIGFQSGPAGTFASANTIEQNGNRGILVIRSSTARIVENIIRNNTGDGVRVVRAAQADIAANTIEGNTRDGVFVSQNSGVNLGNDTGGAPADLPNNTIANNAAFGIRCSTNSYAAGRQGTLNGNNGAQNFNDTSCVNALIP